MRLADPDTMYTHYTARGHCYVFAWRADQLGVLTLHLARLASRTDCDLNWVDAVIIYRAVRRQLEAKREQ